MEETKVNMISRSRLSALLYVGLFVVGIIFILIFTGLSLKHKTLTFDETVHFTYGSALLNNDSARYELNDNSKMPVSVLNVLCARFMNKELYSRFLTEPDFPLVDYMAMVTSGRNMTIIFSILLSILVFWWSKEIYGVPAAFFSFFLYCLDPNIAAHAQLVTGDLYIAFMVLVSTFTFWWFINKGGIWRGLLSACVLGLAQLVKYTAFPLYPLFLLIALIKNWDILSGLARGRRWGALLGRLASGVAYAVLYVIIGIYIINAGFLFKGSFTALKDYSFQSHSFQSWQTRGANVRVPLPYPYLQGMDWVKYADETGGGFGNIYFLGELHKPVEGHLKGFPGYYIVVSLLKVPIATLIILFLAFWTYLRKRAKFSFKDNEQFLLVPGVFFFILYNFFVNMHIGIRHILYIFPLLYVFAGSLFIGWNSYSRKLRMLFVGLILYLFCSVLSYFPHYMAYFNELVRDRKMAYRYLADSNVYIGGNGWWLKEYWQKHLDLILSPQEPVSGRVVVTVNDLVGVSDPERYRWLRDNFQPVDHIAYSYLIFDVLPGDLAKIRPVQ